MNTKLRETITLKRKEAAIGRIEENEGEDRDAAYVALSEAFGGVKRKQVVVGHDANGKEIKQWTSDQKASAELLRQMTKMAQDQNMTAAQVEQALIDAGLDVYETVNGKRRMNAFGANLRNVVMSYHKEYQGVQKQIKAVEQQFDIEMAIDREEAQGKLAEQYKASAQRYGELETSYTNAVGDARKQAAADLLKQADTLEEMLSAAPSYYDLSNDDEKAAYEKFVGDTQARIDGIKGQRETLLKEAGNLYTSRKTVSGEYTTTIKPVSPFGSNAPADSTDYGTWDVNELVARRNQMDKFKNILKPDTDVRTVLAEDKALMKALQNGLSDDWKSVMGWYNQERLKIQQELKSERFSTNLGHWRDDPKTKKRRNPLVESDYALAELDRYYAKRKEQLEKAREEENMSEELYNREAELLEQEHLQKRSDLRRTFTADNSKEEQAMVAQFREWWSALEKSGDLDEVPWATVESEWAKATAAQIGRNNLKAQQDLTQLQSITVKHLNQIAKLVDKERPYDGITANLRDNLTKMDILFADFQKNGPTQDLATLVNAGNERLKFLLGEAETAYSSTIEDVLRRMGEAGMTAWADEIRKSPDMQNALMAQLQTAYDAVQDAIKKEAAQIKKQTDIWWSDVEKGQTQSRKGGFESMLSRLGLQEDQVKRANSLIGAGAASERVADRLAIKQMQVQLAMQQTYYNRMRQIGEERIRQLEAQGKHEDAEHLRRSLNLSLTKEQTELDKQRVAIANQLEESQNRLYTSLKEWGDLLAQSLQSLFEASNAGNAEYYNELAKLDLTGKGGPGAGTYIVIDNEGTEDAKAHYEYFDERQALERQHEIEQENARAEAWRKVMDDINNKLSETITDQLNAMLQNASVDANTQALIQNTKAIYDSMNQATGDTGSTTGDTFKRNEQGFAVDNSGQVISPVQPVDVEQPAEQPKSYWPMSEEHKEQIKEWQTELWQNNTDTGIAAMQTMTDASVDMPSIVTNPYPQSQEQVEFISQTTADAANAQADAKIEASKRETDAILANQQAVRQSEQQNDQQMVKTNKASFAAMTAAANMYGIAYQAMSNDNLSTAQRVQMMIVQAAGQAAMTMLTVAMSADTAETAMHAPAWISKTLKDLGPIGGPVAVGVFTALIGGLMGLATSKITKAKSQISQVTGASVGAGRLATGMLTYAEGNVNEFTDPASLTPGRSYNVDGADGKTYRAKYTGKNPRTHITNGPEFHLVGEAGREAIIDAHTTRLIQQDETGIWQAIQTLYNGGSISAVRRGRNVGRGIRAFKDGNLDDFEDAMGGYDIATDSTGGGMNMEMAVALQASLDRNREVQEALLERLQHPLTVAGTGSNGVVAMYDKLKKEAQRQGVKYI